MRCFHRKVVYIGIVIVAVLLAVFTFLPSTKADAATYKVRVGREVGITDFSPGYKFTKSWKCNSSNITGYPMNDGMLFVVRGLKEGTATVTCTTHLTYSYAYRMDVNQYSTRTHYIIVEGERTVVLNANGGTCNKNLIKVGTLTAVGTLPQATRPGYDFLGWYLADGTKITSQAIFKKDATIYAHWRKNTFAVRFDANGGKCSTTTKNVRNGTGIGVLPKATRKGYRLVGWYTAKSGGNKYTENSVISYDQTVYARWQKVTVNKSKVSKLSYGYGNLTASLVRDGSVDGYQIQYGTSSKYSGAKLVTTTATSKRITGLKPGKKYYVRARAYKLDSTGSKVYGSFGSGKSIKLPAVLISNTSFTFIKGQEKKLVLYGAKKPQWTSSNKNVAKVSSSGNVTAVKTGTVTITAEYKKKKYTCKVKVETPSVKPSSTKFIVGQTSKISVTGTTFATTYISSNKSVATVSSNGLIKGVGAGKANITTTINGKKYTTQVIVEQPKISDTSLHLVKGCKSKITITNTTLRYTFTSSNGSVAIVDANGVITARAKGTALISIKLNGKIYTCSVQVDEPNISGPDILTVGTSKQLTVTGSSLPFSWSSSNTAVATVSGGMVTGKVAGTTFIYVTYESKGYKVVYSYKVTVEAPSFAKNRMKVECDKECTLTLCGTSRSVVFNQSKDFTSKFVYSMNVLTFVPDQLGEYDITVTMDGITYTCHIIVDLIVEDISNVKDAWQTQSMIYGAGVTFNQRLVGRTVETQPDGTKILTLRFDITNTSSSTFDNMPLNLASTLQLSRGVLDENEDEINVIFINKTELEERELKSGQSTTYEVKLQMPSIWKDGDIIYRGCTYISFQGFANDYFLVKKK